jgi:predicted ATP-grasp superfamily ATP-dependent carboligase
LTSINYYGICCIDFIYDVNTKNLKIMEINPRFGGSLVDNQDDFLNYLKCIKKNNIYFI